MNNLVGINGMNIVGMRRRPIHSHGVLPLHPVASALRDLALQSGGPEVLVGQIVAEVAELVFEDQMGGLIVDGGEGVVLMRVCVPGQVQRVMDGRGGRPGMAEAIVPFMDSISSLVVNGTTGGRRH